MKHKTILLPLLLAFALAGCAAAEAAPTTAFAEPLPTSDRFTERDLSGSYDSTVSIHLDGSTAQVSGSGAAVDGSTVTITQEGVYQLSGTLTDGQIIIDAGKSDKIQLILDNADITSQTSAPIYAKKADKVFVTLAADSENTLTNGGSYTAIDDNNIDSVIFAKTDLTLNGTGSLTIRASAGHGIVSKDSLVIASGTYRITAAEHGLTGKDSIAIAAGTFSVTAGEDGIHAKHSEDASLGTLYIAGGDFTLETGGDAISATGSLQIDSGTFRLTTGGGSQSASMKSGDSMGIRFDRNKQVQQDTPSAKGIKSDGSMTILDGTFQLDTADDAVHSGSSLQIAGGTWTISTGDDGIHSDETVTIQGGSFRIPYCYEGVEGQSVIVENGTFDIVSHDDGFNAAGGMDGSGGMPGSGNHAIVIHGGSITIVSDGDSLDSNGSITLNGGTLNLTCNGYGNTAVDCDGNYTNNGADITTNDGSENGTGFGGFGGHGQNPGSFGGPQQPPAGDRRPGFQGRR